MSAHSDGRRSARAAGHPMALIPQGVGLLMAAGTASVACGCLSAFPLLAASTGAVGLAALLGGPLQYPLLYLSVGLAVLGPAIAPGRRPLSGPLVLGVAGATLVLLPFHTALDVAIFYASLYSGFAILVGRALWSLSPPPRRQSAV